MKADFHQKAGTGTELEAHLSLDLLKGTMSGTHFLGDDWRIQPDQDWVSLTLKASTKGEVFPTGSSQMRFKNQLTCRQIVGVTDTNGDPFKASLQRGRQQELPKPEL